MMRAWNTSQIYQKALIHFFLLNIILLLHFHSCIYVYIENFIYVYMSILRISYMHMMYFGQFTLTHPSSFRSQFWWLIKSYLCCPYSLEHGAIHWSIANPPSTRLLKNIDSLSLKQSTAHITPQLEGGIQWSPLFSMLACWLASSYSDFMQATTATVSSGVQCPAKCQRRCFALLR